jgi:hypothetical protein
MHLPLLFTLAATFLGGLAAAVPLGQNQTLAQRDTLSPEACTLCDTECSEARTAYENLGYSCSAQQMQNYLEGCYCCYRAHPTCPGGTDDYVPCTVNAVSCS